MKLLSFIDQLGAVEAAAPANRRATLARLAHSGWRTAAAAVPAGLLLARPAVAGSLTTALDGVLLLLQLARTQAALYTQALAVGGLVPALQVADFQTMLAHHQAHVALLGRALTEGGAAVPAAPAFDFSGRRGVATNPELFPGSLSAYGKFLELAQQLADAGGRMCQGVLPVLVGQRLLYAAVVQLLPVETRHASHLRTLRRGLGVAVKNWPSTAVPAPAPAPPAALAAATAADEDNVRQLLPNNVPVPFAKLLLAADGNGVQATATAEAFDEPIVAAVAQAALDLFVA